MVRSPLSTLIILIVILSLPLSACTPGDHLTGGEPPQPPKGDSTSAAASADPFQKQRLEMVDRQIAGRGIEDPRLLEALRQVPRHAFVPEEYRGQSYADHPLPIGYGQTISQPYVVALMTEVLEIDPGERVLEVGTGSGYQAAVLAEMDAEVYTVEIIPELARRAEQDLQEQGYGQVQVKNADGYFGWMEYAPMRRSSSPRLQTICRSRSSSSWMRMENWSSPSVPLALCKHYGCFKRWRVSWKALTLGR